MELVGKVLWWSEKDQNGIIVDPNGNEFYFDRSVLKLKSKQIPQRHMLVTFEYNQNIHDCLCARNIKIPTAKKKKDLEKDFSQLSLFSA